MAVTSKAVLRTVNSTSWLLETPPSILLERGCRPLKLPRSGALPLLDAIAKQFGSFLVSYTKVGERRDALDIQGISGNLPIGGALHPDAASGTHRGETRLIEGNVSVACPGTGRAFRRGEFEGGGAAPHER